MDTLSLFSVNMHGTSTPLGDVAGANQARRDFLSDDLQKVFTGIPKAIPIFWKSRFGDQFDSTLLSLSFGRML